MDKTMNKCMAESDALVGIPGFKEWCEVHSRLIHDCLVIQKGQIRNAALEEAAKAVCQHKVGFHAIKGSPCCRARGKILKLKTK